MSSQATIVAFDGASTPVSHSLVPASNTNINGEHQSVWREVAPAVPIYASVNATLRRRTLKNGVEQVSLSVSVPVMETVSNQNAAGYTAAPKIAYTNTLTLTGYFSPRATIAERRLARMMLVNISNNITTSVAAATAGPVSEAFDSALTPS